MADSYDALAKRLGIPLARIPDWRQAVGAPPTQSYEGATLQGMAPPPQAPIGPPPPPPRPYEGAVLAAPPSAGMSVAEPPRAPPGGAPANPAFRLASADNVSAPGALSPQVMRKAEQVANASDATKKNVATAIDDNERAKNLAGASFNDEAGPAVAPPGGGGAPVMVDAGGRRPASWQVQQGLDLGPGVAEAVTSADEHGRVAGALDYTAGQQAAEFERGYLDRHNQAAEKFALGEAARAEKYAKQTDAHLQKLDELRGQIREAKVDPNGGMNHGIARVGQAIAIALGAYASKRGENLGLEAVKHTIAANIAKDEQKVNQLERGARGEMTFLGALKQQFGDMQVAKQAAYVAYLESAKTDLAKRLGDPSVADPRLLAAYERLQGKLDDELVHRTGQFASLTQDRVVRHDVNAQPRYVGMGAGAKPSKPDELFVPTGPRGQGFQARSEKEAIAARGLVSAKQQIVPMLERLIELREKTNAGERLAHKTGAYESERMAQIKSLQAQVALGLRELSATSPGAMDKGMQELAGEIQGNFTSVSGNPQAAAKEFISSINRQIDSYGRGQGAQAERQGLTYDAKGNIVTRSVGQASFASPKGPQPSSFKKVE